MLDDSFEENGGNNIFYALGDCQGDNVGTGSSLAMGDYCDGHVGYSIFSVSGIFPVSYNPDLLGSDGVVMDVGRGSRRPLILCYERSDVPVGGKAMNFGMGIEGGGPVSDSKDSRWR